MHFKNSSGYLTELGLSLWYIVRYILELDSKNTRITLMDLDWLYVALDLGLTNTWIMLLESVSFYYTLALDWLNYWSKDVVWKKWRLYWIINKNEKSQEQMFFNYRGINQIKKSTWLSNARKTTKNHQIMLTA